jgi:hypothetical protein
MTMKRLLAISVATMALMGSASADELTFRVRSYHPNTVQVKFYSQTRSHVWPNASEAYDIRDYDVHTYSMTCISNEKICMGAWVKGDANHYWGVGFNDHDGCQNCCAFCGRGDTPIQDLNVK